MYIKQRLFGLVVIIGFIALTYYNWHQLWTEGRYSIKLAGFGPVGIMGGLFLGAFPAMGGKPNTTRERIIVLAIFAAGLVAGLINWYLMDPGFFGF